MEGEEQQEFDRFTIETTDKIRHLNKVVNFSLLLPKVVSQESFDYVTLSNNPVTEQNLLSGSNIYFSQNIDKIISTGLNS